MKNFFYLKLQDTPFGSFGYSIIRNVSISEKNIYAKQNVLPQSIFTPSRLYSLTIDIILLTRICNLSGEETNELKYLEPLHLHFLFSLERNSNFYFFLNILPSNTNTNPDIMFMGLCNHCMKLFLVY